MRLFGSICIYFMLTVGIASAEGISPQQSLERAQICIEALDYECAQSELSKARIHEKMLASEQLIRLHRLGALTALSLGETLEAEEELRRLLELRPDFTPEEGSWPPNWLNVLERVRRGMPDRLAPEIEVSEQLSPAYRNHDWTLNVEVLDAGGVAAVTLFVAVDGRVENIPMATPNGKTWRAVVSAQWMVGSELQYWVEAYDRAGNGPSHWGSVDTPKRVSLSQKISSVDQPLHQKWWFWTALGGVVAVGGATLYLMSGSDPTTPSIQTGKLDVEIQWPSP